MGYSRKNPHSPDRRHTGISHRRRDNSSRNPDGRGVLNIKLYPQELPSSMFPLIQSISFEITALPFHFLLFFQTTDFLPDLFFFKVSIHRLAFITFVEVTGDNFKITRKIG